MNNEEQKKEKSKKAGSPFFILVIFISLIIAIFYVPEIYQKYNKDLAQIFGIGSENEKKITPKNNEDDNKEAMSDYYQIGSNGTLSFNELTIKNVSLDNGILSFTIDTEDRILNLDNLNYYIEFYESKVTYIGRRTLKGEVNRTEYIKLDVKDFNINTSTYFVISHISDNSIPKSMIKSDDSGIAQLTCHKDNLNYKYEFNNNKLTKVTRQYTYTNEDLNTYATELMKYQKIVKERNELNGVTASIAENTSTFIYTLELDYENIEVFHSVSEEYIYSKNTLSSVVNFKMDAEGYVCE